MQRFDDKKSLNKAIQKQYEGAKDGFVNRSISKIEFEQEMQTVQLMKEELNALEDNDKQPFNRLSDIKKYGESVKTADSFIEKKHNLGEISEQDYKKDLNIIEIEKKIYKYSIDNYNYNLE